MCMCVCVYVYEYDVGDQRGRKGREKRKIGVSRLVHDTDHGELSAEPRTSKKYINTSGSIYF